MYQRAGNSTSRRGGVSRIWLFDLYEGGERVGHHIVLYRPRQLFHCMDPHGRPLSGDACREIMLELRVGLPPRPLGLEFVMKQLGGADRLYVRQHKVWIASTRAFDDTVVLENPRKGEVHGAGRLYHIGDTIYMQRSPVEFLKKIERP